MRKSQEGKELIKELNEDEQVLEKEIGKIQRIGRYTKVEKDLLGSSLNLKH